jgi:PAS domain S-box-containing protein
MDITRINCLSRDEIFQEMERARKEERNFFYFRHRLASGEIREVEVHSGPIVLDQAQVLYSIIHDITDKKRIEDALVTANKKLNMLSSITGTISSMF